MESPTASATASETEHYNPLLFKRFLKHVARVTKAATDKQKASASLGEQIDYLSQLSGRKRVSQLTWNKELQKLNKRIEEVIKKESNILSIGRNDNALIQDLRKQLNHLESKLIHSESRRNELEGKYQNNVRDLSRTLTEIRDNIKQAVTLKKDREHKIKNLEAKIKSGKQSRHHEFLLLEQQVIALAKKHEQMSMKKDFSPAALRIVERKILSLKRKIAKAKTI